MNGTIVITGGGRGIGAATALLAADRGYSVCINYRADQEAAETIADRVIEQGGKALAVRADVGDETEVHRLFDQATSALGPVVALVNNAGILEQQSPASGIDALRLERVLRTNVIGAFNCAREAFSRMSRDSGGSGGVIINVSSIAARTGAPFEYVDYAASKGALDTLTAGLAREMAPHGVRVNAVRPGFIYTDMHASGGEPGRVDRLAPGIPLRRGGHAEEVARAILWLASDEAGYAVGTTIDVTGGI